MQRIRACMVLRMESQLSRPADRYRSVGEKTLNSHDLKADAIALRKYLESHNFRAATTSTTLGPPTFCKRRN